VNSVICYICNSVKMSSFLLWSQRVYPVVLLRKHISADITRSSIKLNFAYLIPHFVTTRANFPIFGFFPLGLPSFSFLPHLEVGCLFRKIKFVRSLLQIEIGFAGVCISLIVGERINRPTVNFGCLFLATWNIFQSSQNSENCL
jgi:hypothetical protein